MKKARIAKSHIITYIMTLWDRKFGLILLGLAFFTFACEEPGEIGLELNPENGVFVAKFDELTIPNSIILYEDILSDNSTRIDEVSQNPTSGGRLLVGSHSDPNFGKLKSGAFSSFHLSSAGFKGAEFIFDSLVLKIKVDYVYGDNFLGNKRIYVHELAEEIKPDSLYLTSNSTSYLPEPLGEINFDISGVDTTRIDTVYSARLSDELGMRFLDEAKSDTMTFHNNTEFRKFFNGLAFVSDEFNGMTAGILAESQSTYMRMHFHDNEDTTYFDFIIPGYVQDTIYSNNDTLYSARNVTRYYNNITLDRSGTPIEGITDYHTDFETSDNLSYVQASTGVMTKINLGPFVNFLDTVNQLVINRAELEIPVETYANYFEPSSALDLYLTNQDNKFIEETDTISSKITFATAGRLSFVKEKNENRGIYAGNITQHLQDIVSGESVDSLLLLGQTNLWNSVVHVNQSIIIKDKITLKIYYSTIQ